MGFEARQATRMNDVVQSRGDENGLACACQPGHTEADGGFGHVAGKVGEVGCGDAHFIKEFHMPCLILSGVLS